MIKKILEYLIFSGFTAFVTFATVSYLTHTISMEDFGIVGIYMAILYILPQFISFSSIGLVSINKVQMDDHSFFEFLKKYLTFGIFIFAAVFIVSLLLGLILKSYVQLFILLPIIGVVQYFEMVHNAELIQDGKSRKFGMYKSLLSLISLGFTIIFVSLLHLSWDGRLYAILVSETIVLAVMTKISFFSLKSFQFNVDINAFREYFLFGLPLLFGLFAGWALNQSDRFIVLHFFSLKEVAVYTLAYSIGTILNMINQATTNAIVPIIYKHLNDKKASSHIRKLNIIYGSVIVSIALVIGITSYWYVPIFFGQKYLGASDIIIFIALAFALNGIYRTTGSVIAFYKQNSLQMKLLYIGAVLNIVISIILIPFFGILAPAIGTVVAYIFLAAASYVYGWRILKKEEVIGLSY